MKVAYVCPWLPARGGRGGAARASSLAREAAGAVEVHVLGLQAGEHDARAREELESGGAVAAVLVEERGNTSWRETRARLERALEAGAYDLVHLDRPLPVRLVPRDRELPLVQHHHRVASALVGPGHTRTARVRSEIERLRLRRIERRALDRTRHHVVCGEAEVDVLRARRPTASVTVVPNAVDRSYFHPLEPAPPRHAERLLFLGDLTLGPNAEGLRWFVERVLPGLREERPALKLDVVGNAADVEVLALHGRGGVNVFGRVPDVRPYLAGASALVAPARVGHAARLAVLEALAMGCPVVASPPASAGLPLDLGGLRRARGEAAFREAVEQVLRSAAEVAVDGLPAECSWSESARRLVAAWETAAPSGGGEKAIRD